MFTAQSRWQAICQREAFLLSSASSEGRLDFFDLMMRTFSKARWEKHAINSASAKPTVSTLVGKYPASVFQSSIVELNI